MHNFQAGVYLPPFPNSTMEPITRLANSQKLLTIFIKCTSTDVFFLQMIYTALQNITYKHYRKKKLQNNTVPTNIKPW